MWLRSSPQGDSNNNQPNHQHITDGNEFGLGCIGFLSYLSVPTWKASVPMAPSYGALTQPVPSRSSSWLSAGGLGSAPTT